MSLAEIIKRSTNKISRDYLPSGNEDNGTIIVAGSTSSVNPSLNTKNAGWDILDYDINGGGPVDFFTDTAQNYIPITLPVLEKGTNYYKFEFAIYGDANPLAMQNLGFNAILSQGSVPTATVFTPALSNVNTGSGTVSGYPINTQLSADTTSVTAFLTYVEYYDASTINPANPVFLTLLGAGKTATPPSNIKISWAITPVAYTAV
jgi:hypothetical protein